MSTLFAAIVIVIACVIGWTVGCIEIKENEVYRRAEFKRQRREARKEKNNFKYYLKKKR